MQSVGALFAPPRPFGGAEADRSPFLVVIVRDAEPADLDATPTRGLFRVSRWSEPSVFSRDPPPRLPKAEAV